MDGSSIKYLLNKARIVRDFPQKGVEFLDLMPVYSEPRLLSAMVLAVAERYKGMGITKVACLDARGFITGALIAQYLNASFVPIRKLGKLPGPKVAQTYDTEYSSACIELQIDSITENDIVLLHDDILATGGTAQASIQLIKKLEPAKIFYSFMVEIPKLEGLSKLAPDVEVDSLFKLEGNILKLSARPGKQALKALQRLSDNPEELVYNWWNGLKMSGREGRIMIVQKYLSKNPYKCSIYELAAAYAKQHGIKLDKDLSHEAEFVIPYSEWIP